MTWTWLAGNLIKHKLISEYATYKNATEIMKVLKLEFDTGATSKSGTKAG